ncbi:hypothetical protein FA10DRAFT_264086 [Acaromyces ingoldii]|uniref:Uncharacterized protein n=1 Tax=Acaromyces ingoldii TaxID=215250 RepID=A0A316YZG6_9BASI|nr:hypothetical protein FA10DRAFT_264086 [Acaromyces ingoldii]PWN93433.1 hypothetical protein FA10DRAFT_264086 [Acaromyces ingoldii]
MMPLPPELVLDILALSAWSASTRHARNVCLVCRAAHRRCGPSLFRVVALRNRQQLRALLEAWQAAEDGKLQQHRRLRTDAVEFVYLNNNRQEIDAEDLDMDLVGGSDTASAADTAAIGSAAEARADRVLKLLSGARVLHVEEFWSVNYPWDSQSERPIVAYPLASIVQHVRDQWSAFPGSDSIPQRGRVQAGDEQEEEGDTEERFNDDEERRDRHLIKEHDGGQHGLCNQLNRNRHAHFCLHRSPRAAPEEVTITAMAMKPGDLSPFHRRIAAPHAGRVPPDWPDWASPWTRLRTLTLNFPNMDRALVAALRDLPRLRHLKLSRPFSQLGSKTRLVEAVRALLGLDDKHDAALDRGRVTLESLVIEAGPYMDAESVRSLTALAASPETDGRFLYLSASNRAASSATKTTASISTLQLGGEALPTNNSSSSSSSSSSSKAAIDWVVSSEERAFESFCNHVQRGAGAAPLWSLARAG